MQPKVLSVIGIAVGLSASADTAAESELERLKTSPEDVPAHVVEALSPGLVSRLLRLAQDMPALLKRVDVDRGREELRHLYGVLEVQADDHEVRFLMKKGAVESALLRLAGNQHTRVVAGARFGNYLQPCLAPLGGAIWCTPHRPVGHRVEMEFAIAEIRDEKGFYDLSASFAVFLAAFSAALAALTSSSRLASAMMELHSCAVTDFSIACLDCTKSENGFCSSPMPSRIAVSHCSGGEE